MDYGEYMNRRLHGWGFAKLPRADTIQSHKAVEKGIPVKTVNPRNTSKECHACGGGDTAHNRRRSSVRTMRAGWASTKRT